MRSMPSYRMASTGSSMQCVLMTYYDVAGTGTQCPCTQAARDALWNDDLKKTKGEVQALQEQLRVGTGGYCPSRHPTHCVPSCFELNATL